MEKGAIRGGGGGVGARVRRLMVDVMKNLLFFRDPSLNCYFFINHFLCFGGKMFGAKCKKEPFRKFNLILNARTLLCYFINSKRLDAENKLCFKIVI